MLFLRDWELEDARDAAMAKQSLLNAATHLMNEYLPATSTIGHYHAWYSGDLAAVDILRNLAR